MGWMLNCDDLFFLSYGHAYAQPLTLDTALKLAEQYAPTLRANSAQIEGAENMVSAFPVSYPISTVCWLR